jgi:hypothetical protein
LIFARYASTFPLSICMFQLDDLRSTAAAEAALADSVASVLALHEEFFVCHDRLVRMRLPAMLHVGLIVGNADH